MRATQWPTLRALGATMLVAAHAASVATSELHAVSFESNLSPWLHVHVLRTHLGMTQEHGHGGAQSDPEPDLPVPWT
jgi:hypothetical protein